MTDAARDAARAHLAASTGYVEADAAYQAALQASLRAAEVVGVAYERRCVARASLDKAFNSLVAELREG